MSIQIAEKKIGDFLFFNLTRIFAILTLLLLAGIIVSLTWSAMPSIKAFGFKFLISSEWNPPAERFGALVPIYGTLVTSAIALIIAGLVRLWAGNRLRPMPGAGWVMVGGAITALAGLVIATGWPVNSVWVLGLFLAIDLIFQGWALVAVALAARRMG